MAGVVPPMRMFGRWLLQFESRCVAWSWAAAVVLLMYSSSQSCLSVRLWRLIQAFRWGLAGLHALDRISPPRSPVQQLAAHVLQGVIRHIFSRLPCHSIILSELRMTDRRARKNRTLYPALPS